METLGPRRVVVASFGNHDFDFGVCRQKRARSQWIVSNMTGVEGPSLAEAAPWVVKDHAGVSVGLLAISMNWLNLPGLSTNMTNHDKLAEWTDEVKVPEIDFFLGGHEQLHQVTDRYVIAGYIFVNFCLVTFDAPQGSAVRAPTVQRCRVPAEVPATQEMREREFTGEARRIRNLIEQNTKDFDLMQRWSLEPEVCFAEALDTRKFMQQTQETAAGNLFEDAFLEAMNTMTSTDVSFVNDTEAWKIASSCFVVVLMLAQTPEPKTRSNTTNDRDLIIVLFPGIILSCSSLTGPRIQSTSPNKWQLRSVQQSFGKVGNIEDNEEERDNTPEEIYETIYVKRSTERPSAQDTTKI